MIIEGNEKEKAAMAEFHKGNRKEGLRLQEEFAAAFREEYKEKDHCPCKKHAVIMETVKSAWQFTGHTRSTFPIACEN